MGKRKRQQLVEINEDSGEESGGGNEEVEATGMSAKKVKNAKMKMMNSGSSSNVTAKAIGKKEEDKEEVEKSEEEEEEVWKPFRRRKKVKKDNVSIALSANEEVVIKRRTRGFEDTTTTTSSSSSSGNEENLKELVHKWFEQRSLNATNVMEEDSSSTTVASKNVAGSHHNPPPGPGDRYEPETYSYVDKTLLVADLLSKGILADGTTESTFIFASAMRRSGKTTIIEEMAAMARGEKKSFVGMDVITKGRWPFHENEKVHVIQLAFHGIVTVVLTLKEAREELVAYLIGMIPDDIRGGVIARINESRGQKDADEQNKNLGEVLRGWLVELSKKDKSEYNNMSEEERKHLP
jgi:hypothetical protein